MSIPAFTFTPSVINLIKRYIDLFFVENENLLHIMKITGLEFQQTFKDPKYKEAHIKYNIYKNNIDCHCLSSVISSFHFNRHKFYVKFEFDEEEEEEDSYIWILRLKILYIKNNNIKEIFHHKYDHDILIDDSALEMVEQVFKFKKDITIREDIDLFVISLSDKTFTTCRGCTDTFDLKKDGFCGICYVLARTEDDNCCICLCNELEPWVEFSCKHKTHKKCSISLEKCPICRNEFKGPNPYYY